MRVLDPPTRSALAHLIRQANEAFEGGEYVKLAAVPTGYSDAEYYWAVIVVDDTLCREAFGREWIPGDGAPLDATAAARRLLAAFRDARASQPIKGSP